MSEHHDLVILGSGSTAFAAALRAASHGAKVLMVEKSVLGGTCINWGCVPSKTLIHTALFYQEARLGARYGLGISGDGFDYDMLSAHREEVVKYLRQTRYLDVLRDVPNLTMVRGTGRFLNPHTIEVDEREYRSDRFLVATGGNPRVPEIPGLQEVTWLTSRSALLLKEPPRSLVVIGGGVIALEMGQMYRRLGIPVTVLEHGPRLLLNVESEPALALQQALSDEGMEIVTGVSVCSVARRGEETVVAAELRGERREFAAHRLLLAVGTEPATAGIGLERAGVELNGHGFIRVDERMATSAPGIWAAGDVVGGMMIASAGAREGIVAVDNMFGEACGCTMDYRTIPMAIFTDPEVGIVGLTEAAARAAGYDVVTNVMPAAMIPKAHVTGHRAGVIKMVADRRTGVILGVHLVSHRGAELINEAALAVRYRMTVTDLANTLHVYPSIGEGLRLCALGFGRDLSKLSCCAE